MMIYNKNTKNSTPRYNFVLLAYNNNNNNNNNFVIVTFRYG